MRYRYQTKYLDLIVECDLAQPPYGLFMVDCLIVQNRKDDFHPQSGQNLTVWGSNLKKISEPNDIIKEIL